MSSLRIWLLLAGAALAYVQVKAEDGIQWDANDLLSGLILEDGSVPVFPGGSGNPDMPCIPPQLPVFDPQFCPQAIVNHGCNEDVKGRKLMGELNSKAEVEDAYHSLGLNFFPIPGSEQERLSSRRSLSQFDTMKWCIPGLDCGAGNAILGDLNCDGEFEVCLKCPPGTVPYDSDGDQCEDMCVCCDVIIVTEPVGACCTCDGCKQSTQEACIDTNGKYHGDWTNCENVADTCDDFAKENCGACCTCDGCFQTSEEKCEEMNGGFIVGDHCDAASQEQCVEWTNENDCGGSCCTCDGCVNLSPNECVASGGIPNPTGGPCIGADGNDICMEIDIDLNCTPPTPEVGACCTCDGCKQVTEDECTDGKWQPGVPCEEVQEQCLDMIPTLCGACCTCDGCTETTAQMCLQQLGGEFFEPGQPCTGDLEDKCKVVIESDGQCEDVACCTCDGCFDLPIDLCKLQGGVPNPTGATCANGGDQICEELLVASQIDCASPPPPPTVTQNNITCNVWGDPHVEPFAPVINFLCNDLGGPFNLLTTGWFSIHTINALWGAGPATVMTDTFLVLPVFGVIHHDRCGAGFGGFDQSLLPVPAGWSIFKDVLSTTSTRYEITTNTGLTFCITISRFGGLCAASGWLQVVVDAPSPPLVSLTPWTGYCVGDCGILSNAGALTQTVDGCDSVDIDAAREVCEPLLEVSQTLFDACVLDVLLACDLGAAIGTFDIAGLKGACCASNTVTGAPIPSGCISTSQVGCEHVNGIWNGVGTSCFDSTIECPIQETGACCTCDGCVELTEAECEDANGWFNSGSCEDEGLQEECKAYAQGSDCERFECTVWGDPHVEPLVGPHVTCNDAGWASVLETGAYGISSFNIPFGGGPFTIMAMVKVEFYFPALVFIFKTDGTGFGGVNGMFGLVGKTVLGPFHTKLEHLLHEIRVYRWVTGGGIPYLNLKVTMPAVPAAQLDAMSGYCVKGCPDSSTTGWLTAPLDPESCDISYDDAQSACGPLEGALLQQCINDILAACDTSVALPALGALPSTGQLASCCYEQFTAAGDSVPHCFVGTKMQCDIVGGKSGQDGSVCEEDTCGEGPLGACCTCEQCLKTTEAQCMAIDGKFSEGEDCVNAAGEVICQIYDETDLCPPSDIGACCTCDGCIETSKEKCESDEVGGYFSGLPSCDAAAAPGTCKEAFFSENNLNCPENCPAEPYSGDGNADGMLNVLDVVLGIAFIQSPSDFLTCQLLQFDINGDGLVNVVDLVSMINAIQGG